MPNTMTTLAPLSATPGRSPRRPANLPSFMHRLGRNDTLRSPPLNDHDSPYTRKTKPRAKLRKSPRTADKSRTPSHNAQHVEEPTNFDPARMVCPPSRDIPPQQAAELSEHIPLHEHQQEIGTTERSASPPNIPTNASRRKLVPDHPYGPSASSSDVSHTVSLLHPISSTPPSDSPMPAPRPMHPAAQNPHTQAVPSALGSRGHTPVTLGNTLLGTPPLHSPILKTGSINMQGDVAGQEFGFTLYQKDLPEGKVDVEAALTKLMFMEGLSVSKYVGDEDEDLPADLIEMRRTLQGYGQRRIHRQRAALNDVRELREREESRNKDVNKKEKQLRRTTKLWFGARGAFPGLASRMTSSAHSSSSGAGITVEG